MVCWKNDEDLFLLAKKELFPALVGDVLDKMGYLHQFLPPSVKPVHPGMTIIGRAMPILEMATFGESVDNSQLSLMKQPFGLMFKALDDLKMNEVYVGYGEGCHFAIWGGLMSRRAIRLKAAGAVLNGYSRDTNEILRLQFPTFSLGTYAQDQGARGKVVDFRVPVEWNGVKIHPGDILFGDRDGVVAVPGECEAEAFMGAFEKSREEKRVSDALNNGMSSQDAFVKYGIM